MKKKLSNFVTGIALLFSCCKQKEQQDANNNVTKGVEYNVIPAGHRDTVKTGHWLKVYVTQLYNDSVLRSGHEYIHYDISSMSKESMVIFSSVIVGDSLVFITPADSAFKKESPALVKENGYLITKVKVEKILPTYEEFKAEFSDAESAKNNASQ